MKENFIVKLQTEHFYIGSFDAYLEEAKELTKHNSDLTDEEVESTLKTMPTTYRAAIVDKEGKYVGYVGVYNVDAKNDSASIKLEANRELSKEEQEEILNEFKKYLADSISLTKIDSTIYTHENGFELEEKKKEQASNVIIPCKLLEPGVSEEDLARFSQDYSIPKLQIPYSIKSNGRTVGIIGLSSLIWSNKRANLNIFLDKNLGDDIANELSGFLIDEYIGIVHDSKVHNVTLSVSASDNNIQKILKGSKMNYYGQIPFGAVSGKKVESNLMFQHIPGMEKQRGIYVPDKRTISLSILDTEKKEMDEIVELENGFKMVSPKAFEKAGVDTNKVLQSHIMAMQNRDDFTIPLGEDKYILQKGNGNYGISKALMNFSYVVLDENKDYAGYVNILRTNANGKNVEIEIGIDPKMQHKGLGTSAISKFYDELFSTGVASVTSSVFDFNVPSIRLHEKVAELKGIRLESYYINGRLWDMNIYSKASNIAEEKGTVNRR